MKMKRLMNNLKSFDDIMNLVWIAIFLMVIKSSNAIQYTKMAYYKLRKIPYYMITEHKFGVKICYRNDK